MTIENVSVYGLSESIRAAKFPMSVNTVMLDSEITPGIMSLAQSGMGEGHDNWLLGVVVQYDVTASIKWWTEMERYHFADIVSSQSTMHKITKFDLSKAYSENTDYRMIAIMRDLQWEYNRNPCTETYLRLLYSNPVGMNLTARMTTNYRQLKTIYRQRKFHRLTEWRQFCRWIESLPHSDMITEMKEERGEADV